MLGLVGLQFGLYRNAGLTWKWSEVESKTQAGMGWSNDDGKSGEK